MYATLIREILDALEPHAQQTLVKQLGQNSLVRVRGASHQTPSQALDEEALVEYRKTLGVFKFLCDLVHEGIVEEDVLTIYLEELMESLRTEANMDMFCIAHIVLGGVEHEALQELFREFNKRATELWESLDVRHHFVLENLEKLGV